MGRSAQWLADEGKNGFIARSHLRTIGLSDADFDGRPVVGIANTWSELTPCNGHFRILAEHVRRGVLRAGGVALEFPVMSLGEPLMRPTTMLYRNLASIEVEETLRANPLDAVVLLGGCDKTTPALLMGAASVDLPAIMLTGGPMLNGKFRGCDIGSGTDLWRFSEEVRAGKMTAAAFGEAESGIHCGPGHCMTMGTASTMACLMEAIGMQLPDGAATPAADAARLRLAEATGARAVELAREGLRPSHVLTRDAFHNAIVANAAIGGSTNAVLHLLAIAGRVGVPIALDDFDELARNVPLLVDLMPSGRFLMEEFAYAGGMPAVLAELALLLHTDAVTVTGRPLGDLLDGRVSLNREVIRSLGAPVQPADTGTAVLRGNLAPQGAIIKQSAASPHLMTHRGRAVVFDSVEEYAVAAADPNSDIRADDVLVVRGCGPRAYPGMPEVANLPLPETVLSQGVRDMVRISDARMSGTSYGTVVLHAAPEAALGGPLALVRTGDMISLDVPQRSLTVEVDDEELRRRRAAWTPPAQPAHRGWVKLYVEHVLQSDQGCDLDFLVGGSGDAVPRPAV